MHDKNGKPTGVLAHLVKTHVTNSSENPATKGLTRKIDNLRIDDKASNEELIDYSYLDPFNTDEL